MGLFDKLFKQNKKTAQPSAVINHHDVVALKTEQELMERYGAIALDKQRNLSELIGESNWNIDMDKGEISFGSNLSFPIQVLGTFSHSSNTWLWAWANTQSNVPEPLLDHAEQLKVYGEANGIELLSFRQCDAVFNDLHLIGMVASGMFNASAYYIADYGQGAMVVTLKSEEIERLAKNEHYRILTVFPELISQFEMNHHQALIHYLTEKAYQISENGVELVATKNGKTITAAFDKLSRLTKLNG